MFATDDFKVNSHLTLNLGVRYDKFGVLYEANGLLPNSVGGQAGAFGISGTNSSAMWNPGANAGSLTQLQVVGKHSPHPQPFYPNDWNNFAPSLGFSYKIGMFFSVRWGEDARRSPTTRSDHLLRMPSFSGSSSPESKSLKAKA